MRWTGSQKGLEPTIRGWTMDQGPGARSECLVAKAGDDGLPKRPECP